MATPTAKQLGQAAITTGVTTLYTVPGLTTTILKSFDICNTTGSGIKVRVFLVASGGSAGTSNALIYDSVVPSQTEGFPYGWEGEQVLGAAATIQIQASATGLTITASGVEIA